MIPFICLALVFWGWRKDSGVIMAIAALCCVFALITN